LIATTTLSFAAFGVTLVADLPLVEHFHAGSVGYGLLTTLWGLGAVVGSWIAARSLTERSEFRAFALGTVAMAASIGSIAAMPTFPLAVLVGTVGGVGSGFALTPWFGLVQRHSEDRVRSRVFAAAETCEQIAFVIGMVAGGFIVSAIGPRPTYLVPGGLLAAGSVVAGGLAGRNE
jgi:MFS family permease